MGSRSSLPRLCLKELYRLDRSDEETEWRHTEQDGIGYFVRYRTCKTRIMHRMSANTPGFGFEVFR